MTKSVLSVQSLSELKPTKATSSETGQSGQNLAVQRHLLTILSDREDGELSDEDAPATGTQTPAKPEQNGKYHNISQCLTKLEPTAATSFKTVRVEKSLHSRRCLLTIRPDASDLPM